MSVERTVAALQEVVVPATSANVGCLFDCAALAWDLHLSVTATPGSRAGIELSCEGAGGGQLPRDASNLVVQGLARILARSGTPTPSLKLRLRSAIPPGVGLGSSAAGIVAGLLIGAQLVPNPPDEAILLGIAAELDGHPDNVAAAYLGGLVVAAGDGGGGPVLTRKVEVPSGFHFVVVVPDTGVAVPKSRASLPEQYGRGDAVHNLQRAALLVASAFSGEFSFEPEFFADRWHQARRAELVPGLQECLDLRDTDLLGVCLSGAGPSVLAILRGTGTDVSRQLVEIWRRRGVAASALDLAIDNLGAKGRLGAAGILG
ncbi:MAG: homoserine kinase [Candidatus Dormibacteria bacterium]